MTGFETPCAGGDVRAAPRTGSSMGTVTSALEFRDSESPAGGTLGALFTRGGRVGEGLQHVLEIQEKHTRDLHHTFINDTHHVSYLVPGNNEFTLNAWETAVLVAVPKKVTMLIDDDIWYHFREDGLCLAAARGHIGDRAGADEKIQRAFVIPAHDGMAEMRSSSHLPVQKLPNWINRTYLKLEIARGVFKGPPNLFMLPDLEQNRIIRALRMLSLEVRGGGQADALYTTHAAGVGDCTATMTVDGPQLLACENVRRVKITQHANYLAAQISETTGAMAAFREVLVFGKQSVSSYLEGKHRRPLSAGESRSRFLRACDVDEGSLKAKTVKTPVLSR